MVLFNLSCLLNDCEKYAIDNETLDVFSWVAGRGCWKKLKGTVGNNGYIRYNFSVNGKQVRILKHIIIAKMFINPYYDSKKFEIDHIDHNRQNNSLGNLKIVSKSENNLNRGSFNGIKCKFEIDIGEKIIVDEINNIYYSKTNNKFYRYIHHTNMYREMCEVLHGKSYRINYINNEGKTLHFNVTKFRNNLQFASH